MPEFKPDKMKTVSIQMTDKIEERLSRLPGGNRSANARIVINAILMASNDGNMEPFNMAVELGANSDTRARRLVKQSGRAIWHKSIIWVPQRMYREISRMLFDRRIQVSDFIRGAIIGATDADITEGLTDDGSDLWNADITKSE